MPWIDTDFPCNEEEVQRACGEKVVWKRIKEISCNACLKEDNISPPIQGKLGDCWLICAFYPLTKSLNAWKLVFNAVETDVEKGMISVNLWVKGQWKTVVVDDRLPVFWNNKDQWELLYAHNESSTQFWAALLEKACAKLHGSYELLTSGQPSEAFLLLTGGYTWTELIPDRLKTSTCTGLSSKIEYFLTASRDVDSVFYSNDAKKEIDCAVAEEFALHCYVVTSIEQCSSKSGTSLHLWNPWYNRIKSVSMNGSNDCENQSITYGTTSLHRFFGSAEHNWCENVLHGKWIAFHGGRRGCISYFSNPQFMISCNFSSGPIIFHITLIQPSKRHHHLRKNFLQAIGIHFYQLPSIAKKPLNQQQLSLISLIGSSKPGYQYSQSISLLLCPSVETDINYYVVIPSTYCENASAKFMMRVACNWPLNIHEL